MNARRMRCDRISELPDPLLTIILSYLPTKDSIKTSVLSKRWEFLWLEVSRLDLNANDFLFYGKDLPSFMDRFQKLNHESCLKTFKIKYEKTSGAFFLDCSKIVMEWIAEVVHRGFQHLEVQNETYVMEDLDIDFRPSSMCMRQIMHDENEAYEIKRNLGLRPRFMSMIMRKIRQKSLEWRRDNEKEISEIKSKVDFMPKYMYVSKTLVSLKLVNVGLEDPKFDISLPSLKNMHLENIYYLSGDGLLIIQKLMAASTVLEDLTMDVPHLPDNPKKIVFRKAPECFISTLERVKIKKLIMKEKTGIKLVNYFLVNSAVLKKLTLSLTHPSIENKEFYKSFLTSTKLSPRCQVLVC